MVSGGDQMLVDQHSSRLNFPFLTSASNADRTKMATLIANDLKQLGIRAQVVAARISGRCLDA